MPDRTGLVIFDFDGTLANSFTTGIDILNEIAKDFNLRPIMPEDIPSFRNMSSLEAMKFLRVPMGSLLSIRRRAIHALNSRIDNVLPHAGISEMLHALHGSGLTLGIVTSNSMENVSSFLKKNDYSMFKYISPCKWILGKERALRTIIRQSRILASRTVFVGDETRDIDAARKARTKALAVTWGFQTRNTLTCKAPDALADHPQDVIKTINILLAQC